MTRRIDTKTSVILDRQIPEFVRENFDLFVNFMKQYYDWMDSDGNADNRIKKLIDQRQFVYANDPYVDHLLNDFLVNVPKNLRINYDLLIRNIKSFYASKGTEAAIKYFFNIFRSLNTSFGFYISYSGEPPTIIGKTFTGNKSGSKLKIITATVVDESNIFVNVELLNYIFPERGDIITNYVDANEHYETNITNFNIDISYPKTRILRSSNGNWKNSSVIVIKTQQETNFSGKPFTSSINNNIGFIDTQNLIKTNTNYYYELKVSFNSFTSWSDSENIIVDNIEYECSTVCSDTNIISGGSNYSIGDEFDIKDSGGVVGKLRVKSTTRSKVTKFKVLYGGYDYAIGDELIIGDNLGLATVTELGALNSIASVKIIYSNPWISEFQKCTISSQSGYDADILFYSDDIGKIKELEILDSGTDIIPENCFVDVPARDSEYIPADIAITASTLKYTNPGFISDSGFLDASDKLQDNFYFQDYSYVIKSDTKIDYSALMPIYKKLVHPAGTKVFFTSVNNTESTLIPSKLKIKSLASIKTIILFSYGYKRIFDNVDYESTFKNTSNFRVVVTSTDIGTLPKIIVTNQYLYLNNSDTINTITNTAPTMHKYSMQPGHKETIINTI